VKLLLAILFSATLVWGQSVPIVCAQVAPPASASHTCACGHCGKTCCCLNKSAPDSKPAPAAPAPQVTQSEHLLLPLPGAVAFILPSAANPAIAHPLSSLSRAAALPLYQQNCSFLI
jgi:hypothetical protein